MSDSIVHRPIRRPALATRAPIGNGPFLVAGLGRAGRAAVLALRHAVGPERVRAWDADTGSSMQRLRLELEAEGIRTRLGTKPTRGDVKWARVIVKSPGVPFQASVIQRALGMNREVIDELELGWRLSRAPVVAVTGTNGKSTVSGLACHVMSAAGLRVELAGNTDFGSCLSQVVSTSLDWIVCETSSFQLEGCVHLLPELAVFTNLTPEHLGRHGTLERYGAIKRRLFINGGVAVSRAIIDVDDAFGRKLASDAERLGAAVSRVGFSADADYRIESTAWDLRGAETQISTPSGGVSLRTSLPGRYNARNVAAALALADLIGIGRRISLPRLSVFRGPPGRFEPIDAGQPFDVIVDFANTPDALEQLLTTIREAMMPDGGLRLVLGLGGAPGSAMEEMGRIGRRLSDHLVLTTSGSRGLPPVSALESVLAGARTATTASLEIVLNRHRAIERAVSSAAAADVVVIAGRGAIPDMRADPRGVPIPFDDRAITRAIVRALVDSRRGSEDEAGRRLSVPGVR